MYCNFLYDVCLKFFHPKKSSSKYCDSGTAVWSGLVWSGLVWSGVVWSGLVWSGLVWSGLVCTVATQYACQSKV
jgi:hypothetical protein